MWPNSVDVTDLLIQTRQGAFLPIHLLEMLQQENALTGSKRPSAF